MSKSRSQLEKNPNWKGDNVGYHGLHAWLKRHYGHADKCDNVLCKGKSSVYEWALIIGKRYERKRENFMKLCSSCHKKYDSHLRKSRKVKDAQFKVGFKPWNFKMRYSDEQKSILNTKGLVFFKKGYIPWNKGVKVSQLKKP